MRYLPQQGGNSRATADIEPCCNLGSALPQPAAPTDSVVTTRREPVVTTRTQPQHARAMSGLSQAKRPRCLTHGCREPARGSRRCAARARIDHHAADLPGGARAACSTRGSCDLSDA